MSTGQEIVRVILLVHYAVHETPKLVPDLSKTGPLHTHSPIFLNFKFWLSFIH